MSKTTEQQKRIKIEAFEMCLYKRILRISWVDRGTNKTVLERIRKERKVMIKRRNLEYLEYIMKNKTKYKLIKFIR